MQTWRILVVDDDPDDRMIVQDAMEILDSANLIKFAESGDQALTILETYASEGHLPSLIVLDLNMPKMNGTETLRVIKNKKEFNGIPVIIYSTSINSLEKEKCMELGADDYITKPISFRESQQTAEKLLQYCNNLSVSK
jgi:CheY-like chemotaxis protein